MDTIQTIQVIVTSASTIANLLCFGYLYYTQRKLSKQQLLTHEVTEAIKKLNKLQITQSMYGPTKNNQCNDMTTKLDKHNAIQSTYTI